MLKKCKQILSLFMAIFVLASSHSFAYFEHICTVTQTKTLSFDLKTCADDFGKEIPLKEQKAQIKKSTCCEVGLKVNQASDAVQQHFSAPHFLAVQLQIPVFDFGIGHFITTEARTFEYADSSPPYKKTLYIVHEQFLI